jgi:2-isopropylmalate synthase
VLSVHCHDDLGLAVANTLAAVQYGAKQMECTINGIGERAGNAALEEIVMAIKTRSSRFTWSRTLGIDTTQIYKTSKLVSELTGFDIQVNKAIVGQNAFRHASGIHQHGILNDPTTYQIIDPKAVGMPETQLPVGKLSGRHALEERLLELGYSLNEEEFKIFYDNFKKLADKKKEITDKDLESLIAEEQRKTAGTWRIDRLQVTCGDKGIPMAGVRIIKSSGEILEGAALGTGPVDAVYKAINQVIDVSNTLTEFTIKSITEGIDAIGEVLIRIESGGVTYTGRGTDTDIIVASAKAYLNALNRLLAVRK